MDENRKQIFHELDNAHRDATSMFDVTVMPALMELLDRMLVAGHERGTAGLGVANLLMIAAYGLVSGTYGRGPARSVMNTMLDINEREIYRHEETTFTTTSHSARSVKE